MRKSILMLLLFNFLIIAGCQKDKEGDIVVKEPTANSSVESSTVCNYFTSSEIDSMGITHNQYLDSLLIDLDLETTEPDTVLDSMGISFYWDTLSNASKREWIDERHITMSEVESEYSQALIDLLDEAIDVMDQANDVTDIVTGLSDLETDVINDLSCEEEEVMLAYLSVAKSSAEYWFPSSLGGTGISNINNYRTENIPGLSKEAALRVLKADAISVFGSFMAMPFLVGATSNPVTLAGLAVVVGIPAAIASGWQLLEELSAE